MQSYCIILFSSIVLSSADWTMKQGSIEKNIQQCKKLAKDPFFEPEFVLGKPWRIYYTWNMKIETTCMDLVFRNVTAKMIQRIWSDMSDYMEQQPYWDSASLHVTSGAARHEMLLFPAEGAAGSFLGVPNVVRQGDMTPVKNGVPLLKFQLKLVRGKYLVMMDCHVGVTTLSARAETPPYRSEIAAAVAELDIGDGFPACTQEKNKGEQFFVK